MNKSEMLKKTAHIEGMLRGLVEQVSTLSTDVNSSLQAARRLESSLMEKEKAAKEEEEKVVSVRSRFKGDEGQQPLEQFIDAICKEIRTKEIRKEEVQPESK